MLAQLVLLSITIMARCCARLSAVVETVWQRCKAKEILEPLLQQCRSGWGATCPREEEVCVEPALSESWLEAGISEVDVTIRALSGEIVVQHNGATMKTKVNSLVKSAAAELDLPEDRIQLWLGTTLLKPGVQLGDLIVPEVGTANLEVALVKFAGPPVTAESTSGSRIEVLDGVPQVGELCHADRTYRFQSLGGFALAPHMRYVLTSNEDKRTPASKVMWKLQLRDPAKIYLNFRGTDHVAAVADKWLHAQGWQLQTDMASTISSGTPNGPYQGPVYAQEFQSGTVELMGAAYWEGTYFVFVQLQEE
mmetsp:Transcript_33367/g.61199  ORF Transcript_33367/g.61199 Transcript_33367/m.61199 type:complete len:308 (+) Transcript_33367:35-958(+)